MLAYFAVFCKNCGSYEVDKYKTLINDNEDIIFECKNCQVAESVKAE